MSKRGIFILIFTLITLVVWFGLDFYHRQLQVKLPEVSEEVLVPLDPELGTQTLDSLQARQNPNLPEPLKF